MGSAATSLLDDSKSTYVKGQAEAELQDFSPYYRKQFSVARFSQVQDELEQHKAKVTQLLKQRDVPANAEVLYEGFVFYFDDSRKWKERYVVVRANYCLDCHDSLQSFVKGVPPRYKLLPTGGTVQTTEEVYMALVDKCFPDDTNVKEDFGPPLAGMPGEFPVYLHLPYRSDSYFCFKQEEKRASFLSILSDCIRHQNQDFLKKEVCEVQAFLKAVQLYRQDKGKYEAWDMLVGSDGRVMANLVMEQLLPSLETDLLPRLKVKKSEKKRVWFATVEAAYFLVQEHLLDGLYVLKEECRTSVQKQEVLMHSDLDQILNVRRQLEEKIQEKVSEPAERLCSESVQPYLGSVLDELMEPISSGFQEGRQLSENMMDQVCEHFLVVGDNERMKKALSNMARPNLSSCYHHIASLQDKLQNLQERFNFSDVTGVIHSAQIDLQQLMDNAAYTFEQLLCKAVEDNPDNAASAVEKAKHRVLKQYDYDSSTVRKKIFQEALVSITLPFIKKNLAPICKNELQGLEQFIYADYSNFIHVENVYESVLLTILDKEVTKVVKEAATLKKHNLFTDRDMASQSSRSSLSSPSPAVSTPGSPATVVASSLKCEPQPPSPLVTNCLKRITQEKEMPAPKAAEVKQTVKAEDVPISPEASALADSLNVMPVVYVAKAAETVVQEEVISVKMDKVETGAEPEMQSTDDLKAAETLVLEVPTVLGSIKTDAGDTDVPVQSLDPTNETSGSLHVGSSAGQMQCESTKMELEAPPSGEEPVKPEDISLDMAEDAEPITFSDPNSLDVSVGSESPVSDLESTEEAKELQSGEDQMSTASDVPECEPVRGSPVRVDEATHDEPSPPAQLEAVSDDVGVGGGTEEAAASAKVVEAADITTSQSQPGKEEDAYSATAGPPDCVKEIRDLVVEVFEVEEMVQHYPGKISKEE